MLRCSCGTNAAPSLHQRGGHWFAGPQAEVDWRFIFGTCIQKHTFTLFFPPVTVRRSAAGNWTFILVSVCDIYTLMQTLYIELQTTNKGV